jgi:hypothetical protein
MENAAIEEDGSDILHSLARQLQDELPRISDAVKNLMALLMAQSFVDTDFSSTVIAVCAKALLYELQHFDLVSLEEFCEIYPQQDQQLAVSRLDEVCRYKVVLAARQRLSTVQSAKVSKYFGKSFVVWSRCWSSLRLKVEQNLSSQGIGEDFVKIFLNVFEDSLVGNTHFAASISHLLLIYTFVVFHFRR